MSRITTRLLRVLVLTALLGATVLIGALQHSAARADTGPTDGDVPAPKTIVNITGDEHGGFHIERYDGTFLYPPTLSEATAECQGYEKPADQLRCRVHVRTWYHDLGTTQAALGYAHRQSPTG